MAKWHHIAGRFGRDESGVFAVFFGILTIVLVALGGSAVDFVNIQNIRSITQASLDSAALMLQPKIYTQSENQLKELATALVVERLSSLNATVTIETVTTDTANGSLFLEARLQVPLPFLSMVGVNQINTRVASQATQKQLFLEVGMVLDNSGSMNSYSRMANLKIAATNATEILFDGAATSTTVKVGIVPFTSFVNIGANNAGASWIDVAGNSSIANDNFDDDDNDATPFTGPVNRLALYNQMSNVSWGGCVEARPHTQTSGPNAHLDTDDTTPDPSNPDTYFVPSFSPDTPDWWASWQSDYISDTAASACPYLSYYASDREHQERLCKYSGSIDPYAWGPNFDCPAAATLPLSATKQSVLNAINAMSAGGATNIHQGAIWGFRLLSPSEPFSEGRPYNQDTAKALIIMTDGENTMYGANNMNGAYYYSPYGFPYNGRIGAPGWSSSQLTAEMDARTLESCANAKAAGITIYTIGLNPPNTSTKSMLEQCATTPSYAYFPTDPTDLNGVFAEIANQLSALRLAQ